MLLRQFGALPLAVVEPPHGGTPTTILSGGQSTVFRGSRHREAAVSFLAYMADEDYNMQIVRCGDALPPNPRYAGTDLFRHPPDYPNEWGCHEAFLNAAQNIAVVQSFSPFVLPVVVDRAEARALDEVLNGRATPAEAAAFCARQINEEIERNVMESPVLRRRHEAWAPLQPKIEQCRREGKPVPADWIKDPFLTVVYRRNGWLAE